MNYEVMCITNSQVVEKEYFETLHKANEFQRENELRFDCISITPMNEKAHQELMASW
jgi:hypothetical protein